MSNNWWRARTIASVVVLLAILATALLVGARGDGSGGSDPSATTDGTVTTTTTALDPELVALLTVNTTTVSCPDLVEEDAKKELADGTTVISPLIGALLPVADGGRKWSDALSTPVSTMVPADALKEIQTAICLDPLLGVTVAHLFGHMEVEGIKVVELNDWLKPFAVDANEINDLAAGFVPLLDVKAPTSEQLTEAISQNLEYQELAKKLGTLLDRFNVVGIMPEQSVQNYHLEVGGLVTGKLPEVGLNPNQESMPALVLDLTAKPGICLARIGFNTGDKRPEVFGCPLTPPGGGGTTVPGGKDASLRPPQDPVISCPDGQFADRTTGNCTAYSATTTTTYDNSGGDSGPGAPGSGVSTPPTDPTPDPTVPTNTSIGDGTLPDPGV